MAGNQIITPEDYATKNLGSYTTVTVSGTVPATGLAYVTIHLDYGLKHPVWTDGNPADIDLTNSDNDTAGVTVSAPSSSTTTEAGGTVTFTIRLNSEPTSSVTLPLSSTDTSEGTVSPSSLTFTAANWNVPQTVTVVGVNDNVDDGLQVGTAPRNQDAQPSIRWHGRVRRTGRPGRRQ